MVVSQARSIADSSLSLVFEPTDLTAPVGSIRATELTDQIQGVVVDPSDFDQVTIYSPEGTILYSTEEGRIGNELPGEKDHIKDALKDTPVVTTYQGNVSIMLPLQLRSGVGSPAVVQLTRPNTPIATAPGPWNTNALFLFAMLVVLGLAVFGVARLLSVVANAPERAAELPRPAPAMQPTRAASQPGLREEGGRGAAPKSGRPPPKSVSVCSGPVPQVARGPRTSVRSRVSHGPLPTPSSRSALRAEGQLRTLETQVETLRTERAWANSCRRFRAPVPLTTPPATLEEEAEGLVAARPHARS
jgi:hypothetical protein